MPFETEKNPIFLRFFFQNQNFPNRVSEFTRIKYSPDYAIVSSSIHIYGHQSYRLNFESLADVKTTVGKHLGPTF